MQRYFEDIVRDESIRPVDLSTFSADYFGTSDPLYDAMWAAVLRGAVWRVFEPGGQFDFVLTLKGDQGIRKSSSFQALVPDPDWFSSSTHDQPKDMTVALHRVLITELAELEHITGKRSTAKTVGGLRGIEFFLRRNHRPKGGSTLFLPPCVGPGPVY